MEEINKKKREVLKKVMIGIVGIGAMAMMPIVLADARLFRDDGTASWLIDKDGNRNFVDLQVDGILNAEGGNIRNLSVKTNDYTILSSDYTILADATNNPVTITLPASANQGQVFNVFCINSTFACNVARNGNNINGVASDRSLGITQSETYQFDSSSGWQII